MSIAMLKNIDPNNIEDILIGINKIYGSDTAFSTSFSLEDQLITHYIFTLNLPFKVFTIDTGRLFSETYHIFNQTLKKYKRKIEVFSPNHEKLELMLFEKGPFSFYDSIENRKECCLIRKVEPLNRALVGTKCWLTGIRADHSELRSNLSWFEKDNTRNLIKVHPLLFKSIDEIKNEILNLKIPYNELYDKGYLSIGCQPCTRVVNNGDSIRSGRWWWENSNTKECGLHIK